MDSYKEKFKFGSLVRIADHEFLNNFQQTWKDNNNLSSEQLTFAGRVRKVKKVGFYHGGYILYELKSVPGVWHEQCLQPFSSNKLKLSDIFQLFVMGLIGGLPLAMIIYRLFFSAPRTREQTAACILFGAIAAVIAAINLYLAFIRPWRYKRKHGNLLNYKNVSGIPLIGGFFVLVAALYLPSSYMIGVFLLVVYFSDVASIPWFFIQLLRHGF